jgi:hypothetical protein
MLQATATERLAKQLRTHVSHRTYLRRQHNISMQVEHTRKHTLHIA